MTDKKKPYAWVAYDMKQKKVGCVLIQSLFGGVVPTGGALEGNPASHFDNKSWLLAPTPDTKLYEIATKEEFEALVRTTDAIHVPKKR
jgi:hypothetical protein